MTGDGMSKFLRRFTTVDTCVVECDDGSCNGAMIRKLLSHDFITYDVPVIIRETSYDAFGMITIRKYELKLTPLGRNYIEYLLL